ncbi:MAG: cell surface protein SprA [Paludibacteraceae bacterium]|nr:cell surface protein SprA [Paludibacteraceae bacterium]
MIIHLARRSFILFSLLLPLAVKAQEPQLTPAQVRADSVQRADSVGSIVSSSLPATPDQTVETTIEYQPLQNTYLLRNKIGELDIESPYLMNAEEYKQYQERQFIRKYWQQKIGEVEHNNEKKFDITDMKFNIGPADKIFGPGGVQLKLQGSAELIFGFNHQFVDNPSLTRRAKNNNVFDFDEKIQVNVNGKVGDRLNLNLSYNTEATFSFDQQNIKLAYKGQEDDIIQSIEGGNVSLDLNSQLIRGSQALFGVKTNLKFGRLKVQAVISQQNSDAQQVSSEGGAQMTKYEVTADHYDENKHFFLSYYFRDRFETAMSTLPYASSGVTINRIEVWVTNRRGTYDQARNFTAFIDLGEGDITHLLDQSLYTSGNDYAVPANRNNALYDQLMAMGDNIRSISQITTTLQANGNWVSGENYEKVESARLLTSGEYTLNPALGFISLRTALNQDEVLAVAYEYTYGGQVYQVGEFSTDVPSGSSAGDAAPALILKLLKPSNNSPHSANPTRKGEHYGSWDLMMKNFYSLGASTMSSDKFELYVQYRNDSIGTQLQYLTEGPIKGKQLLRVLNADRLDTKNNASPDGRFDYVEGYTAFSSTGRIMFPVLEPFGSHLAAQLGNDPALVEKYCFQELYDSTRVQAQEMTEKNKFVLTGKYKGTNSSEIRLNAMNVPRGSVKVTAGGATLTENVDYTVDYTMGVVTILNQSILDAGTQVNVQLENQSTFSMVRKGLYGANLQYDFSKDFSVGGTIMYMHEAPLTTKVNAGSEPLNNMIWGLNLNYQTQLNWLSNAIEEVPWMSASAPSTFQIGAEFAHLVPGHTNEVGKAGTAYMDDFESTTTGIDVHYPTSWFLASTPSDPANGATDTYYEDARMSNDYAYNRHRAHLSWYTVDPIFGHPQTNTPMHIKNDPEALSDHRTRIVYEQEIYPNKEVLASEDTRMTVLNLSYYPTERGQYNISADRMNNRGELIEPEKNWGGIMRRLDNTDFETSNIEYIQFWLMDPRLTNDESYSGADLYINLGDISEDILRDGKKSFEHGLPLSEADRASLDSTAWGYVSKTTSTTVAFSNEAGARERQDVGLNGLSTAQEFAYEYNGKRPYADFVSSLRSKLDPDILTAWQQDAYSPLRDPAGDNYHYYRGTDYDQAETPILQRYKHVNGTEGNSPESSSNDNYGTAWTLSPDIEDINRDNTLNETEKYFEYHVSLDPSQLQVGMQHISEKLETNVTLKNGQTVKVTWYQFKIPVKGSDVRAVGNIRNYKSIRFMRMYLTGCKQTTHLRFATLELVRGEWRNYSKGLYYNSTTGQYNTTLPGSNALLDVQAINIEENGARSPINYVLPPGISRQTDPGQAQLIAQNEQALVLKANHLQHNDALAVYKNVTFDLRNYKRLQMFVHAEAIDADPDNEKVQDGDLSCFIRIGSDLKYNYYEYEIPLSITQPGVYNNDNVRDRAIVWPQQNEFNFPLSIFTEAKTARNKAKRAGDRSVANNIPYVIYDTDNGRPDNKVTVVGNPTLGEIETVMIGVRNRKNNLTGGVNGEIWVNELRMSEFNEEGGVAAIANAALKVSDIAQLNVTGRLETAGYGSIESNVQTRNMEDRYNVAVSAALEAGRLVPQEAHLQIPLYVSYSNETMSPKYDPIDSDVKLKDNLETYTTKAEKDSVRRMTNTRHENTSFSISNLKVDIHSKKKNMFYDPANFSLSAAYNKQKETSPELENNQNSSQKGSFNYAYSFNPQPWEPFKKNEKVKDVKLLSELNIYYLPQSWSFNTNMQRNFTALKMRDFNAFGGSETATLPPTFSKDFMWDRNFDFKFDLTKNMKFTFHTAMNATVDEGYYTPEIIKDYGFTNDYYEGWKDTLLRSMGTWGTPYTYQQVFTASWSVPFNRIPYLDCLTANASYNGTYTWNRTAGSTTNQNLGNTVASTRAIQADGQLNLETLYGKSTYWKQMTQRMSARPARKTNFREKKYTQTLALEKGKPATISHRLGSKSLKAEVKDADGKAVPAQLKAVDNNSATLTVQQDVAAASITIVTKDPSVRTPAEQAMDFAAFFGTMIRRVQVTYRQTNSMTVPGFNPMPGFMGQRRVDNMYAPGFDFAFGFFKDDFVEQAKANGWLALSSEVVQPSAAAFTQDFDYKVTLEPFPGFKVQVNGKRYEAQSVSKLYGRADEAHDFTLQQNATGSFNITQIAIGTAFDKVGNASTMFASKTFDRFLENRAIMAQRLENRYQGVRYPTGSTFIPDSLVGQTYRGGRVNPAAADVLVPTFLATYTGTDISRVSFNPFLSILRTMPNWSVTFDGLGRLPWMRDNFRSVTLTHAYTCKYAIGSYSSFSTWVSASGNDRTLGFTRDVTTQMPTPSASYDISSVSLQESFSPLIGVNMTMKNSLSIKAEYRKQRNITLNVNSVQLTEGYTNEFVIGAGYTIKDFHFTKKSRDGKQSKVSNDLKLNVDVGYKNIMTLLRKVDENLTQASSGNRVLTIKISADYVLSQRVSLKLFYDHEGNTPLISNSYPINTDNAGISVRLMLTR